MYSTVSLTNTIAILQPSRSYATELKFKSPSKFATAKPNLSTDSSSGTVCGSLRLRTDDRKTKLARFTMMSIGTPRVPYKLHGVGTVQWINLWDALYLERVIFLGQYLNEEYSNQILATMLYLDSIDESKRLYLYINSYGGDVSSSLALYDTMKGLKSPVGTYCMGHANNLAAFLLAAGDKGHRLGMPLCHITIEPPAGAARGQADDIQNETKELIRIRDYLCSELSKISGHPMEKVTYDLNRKMCLNAQEAKEYGIIDHIIRPAHSKTDEPREES